MKLELTSLRKYIRSILFEVYGREYAKKQNALIQLIIL